MSVEKIGIPEEQERWLNIEEVRKEGKKIQMAAKEIMTKPDYKTNEKAQKDLRALRLRLDTLVESVEEEIKKIKGKKDYDKNPYYVWRIPALGELIEQIDPTSDEIEKGSFPNGILI